jgi:hypothetical protein
MPVKLMAMAMSREIVRFGTKSPYPTVNPITKEVLIKGYHGRGVAMIGECAGLFSSCPCGACGRKGRWTMSERSGWPMAAEKADGTMHVTLTLDND